MELVTDADDMPAPRLNDVALSAAQAVQLHAELLHQVVIMLCAGIIHGDLSEYNVLLGKHGLVIIDLPQAVNAAGNMNASAMLERDVANLANYFGRFAPELLDTQYGKEMWLLYESGKLKTDTELTGKIALETRVADVAGVLEEVNLAIKAEEARRLFLAGE